MLDVLAFHLKLVVHRGDLLGVGFAHLSEEFLLLLHLQVEVVNLLLVLSLHQKDLAIMLLALETRKLLGQLFPLLGKLIGELLVESLKRLVLLLDLCDDLLLVDS